ncbi:putative gustatory receptor 28b [Hetaerina americana]|uniref:putative gustatory receptor 28b n=1 Tax=Hetaerina americana TaxID=62018 RepID=UPI003A7F261E
MVNEGGVTTKELERTLNITHKLLLFCQQKDLCHELYLFTHQLMLTKISYTAYEVFTLKRSLLYSMNGAFTMCFIVLMQMKVSELNLQLTDVIGKKNKNLN